MHESWLLLDACRKPPPIPAFSRSTEVFDELSTTRASIVASAFHWGISVRLRTDWRRNIALVCNIKRSHGVGKCFTKPLHNEFHAASRCVVGLNQLCANLVDNRLTWAIVEMCISELLRWSGGFHSSLRLVSPVLFRDDVAAISVIAHCSIVERRLPKALVTRLARSQVITPLSTFHTFKAVFFPVNTLVDV